MKILLVCALFAVAVISLTSASCIGGEVQNIAYQWSNKTTPYCEYEGKKYGVDSHFTDLTKCQTCDCKADGLQCCGIGYYVGSMSVAGCAVIPDGCEAAILNIEKTDMCQQV